MDKKDRIRRLSEQEQQFAGENFHLINEYLKRTKLDPDEFFDVVILEYLLSVEKYLEKPGQTEKCSFEAFSYMYMKRAVYRYFREQKALKRCSGLGENISLEQMESLGKMNDRSVDPFVTVEHKETLLQIAGLLDAEQWKILLDKVDGYTLADIAQRNGIESRRIYTQFGKIRKIIKRVIMVE